MRMPDISVGILLCVELSGCAEGSQLAIARASKEYDCPQSELRVKWVGTSQLGEVYRVNGCGVVVTYACQEGSETCLKESDDRRDRSGGMRRAE
jgi:hypothetical protein